MIYRKAHHGCAINNVSTQSADSLKSSVPYKYPVLLESLAQPASLPNRPFTVEALPHESIELAVSLMDGHMLR